MLTVLYLAAVFIVAMTAIMAIFELIIDGCRERELSKVDRAIIYVFVASALFVSAFDFGRMLVQ